MIDLENIDLVNIKKCCNKFCTNYVFNDRQLLIDSTREYYVFCDECLRLFNNIKPKNKYKKFFDINLNSYNNEGGR